MKEKTSYFGGCGMKACVYPETLDNLGTVECGYLGSRCILESYCPLEMMFSGLKIPALCGTWTPEVDFIREGRLEGDLTQEMETYFLSKAIPSFSGEPLGSPG